MRPVPRGRRTARLSDENQGPGYYELEVKASGIAFDVDMPGTKGTWLEDQEFEDGKSQKYLISTVDGDSYLLHARGGARRVEIDGKRCSGLMGIRFNGNGKTRAVQVFGSGKFKLYGQHNK